MVKASASKKSTIIEDVLKVIGEYVNNELKKGVPLQKNYKRDLLK
jgi:transposase